ncbi:SdpA family antimicrobial peptide system protein [Actinomyces lilanjuaniae]|uniref:SdpA family antimicrobial peptide system protein n=1 Tax=Actinomyces lilanjuaniae TaxID=2321394 RepID=A0ABM6Z404_9ACTO|nr:SdpA family antimicrobial peptide system protein [Actinomyces lilanjuaniae]
MNDDTNVVNSYVKPTCAALLSLGIAVAVITLQAMSWLPVRETGGSEVKTVSRIVRTFTMQGWAFFTKSPRDDFIVPYKFDEREGVWHSAARGPAVQPRYVFGLNRESRLTEFDIQEIIGLSADDDWVGCENVSKFESCLEGASTTTMMVGKENQICGSVAIVEAPPVPWMYRKHLNGMPGRVLFVNTICEN